MSLQHSCGADLELLRRYSWDKKKHRTVTKKPITKSGAEMMWCPSCQTGVEVEVHQR